VKQDRPAINRFGYPENVGGEMSGTMLVSGAHGRWLGFKPTFDTNMTHETETKCLLKIGAGKAEIGVAIAEGKRALNMLAGTAKDLLVAYRQFRNGNLRGMFTTLKVNPNQLLTGKSPSDYLLQWRYGWRPLIVDMRTAYDLTRETFEKYDMLVHGRSSTKFQYEKEDDGELSSFTQFSERCLTRIDARVDCEVLRAATQVGLVNPLSIAWELFPFSFVLDWAMPVGNVLEAASAANGLSFAGGSTSRTMEVLTDFHKNLAFDSRWLDVGHCVVEKFATERVVLGDFPIPLPYIKTRGPFSTSHVESALALWRSTMKSR
jgi:hypothetical protein